ncbi:TonB-dependent receptor plug domain-containing protein [Luteimonas viscosa]|nr:TonB-dependent receptor [Luteimonas viscosa]
MDNGQPEVQHRLDGAGEGRRWGCLRTRVIAKALATALAALFIGCIPGRPYAQPPRVPQSLAIPAGSLREALDALASASGTTLLYSPDLVAGKTTSGLSGRYAPGEALRLLLRGSGLEARDAGDATFTLRPAPAANGPGSASQATRRQLSAPVQVRDLETIELGGMTITGTRIRGGVTPSPVITISAENTREEGFSDLGDVIRSVPQNFSGGQNPGVPSLGYSGAGIHNQNVTGGSALNLRGLGPDATLTLLNGRRMAYGGMAQAVDIDAIPVEAVDRIEILLDGASAIYGSDAVGGVGNVILKRDFDDVVIGVSFGGASDGGMATREYTATAGSTWGGGGLITTFKNARADPIYVRQRDYASVMRDPTTLYPGINLKSAVASMHQAVGAVAEMTMDAMMSRRDQLYNVASPDGWINRVNSETTTKFAAPGVRFFLPNDWTLALSATRGTSEHIQYQRRDTAKTGDSTLSVHDCLCNKSTVYEVGADGALFELPGGEARVAVGAGYRRNEYLHFNHLTGTPTTGGKEGSRFAYIEADLPVFGKPDDIGDGNRLSITAALRGEDYDSFGGVILPKLGLIYGPSADLTLKASWGKSFKGPTLRQRHLAPYVMLAPPAYFGGTGYAADATILADGGGNRDLGPERARTWTASLAFHPDSIPGLDVEVTWYDIDYTDRALEPITNFSEALSNPIYAQFIEHAPTPATLDERISDAATFHNFVGAPYDPANVAALVNLQHTNVARQEIRGVGLSGAYRFNIGDGSISLRGSAIWLDSTQQNTDLQVPFDLAGTLSNPPKFGCRLGGVWTKGRWTMSAFVNHKGGVRNLPRDEKTASFTTLDAALRFATTASANVLPGLELTIAGQNLFNRVPPPTTPWLPAYAPPYDATNYSAVGRFLSISLSKQW